MLSAHYRNPINFSKDLMEQAKNGLDRMYTCLNNLEFFKQNAQDSAMNEQEVTLANKLNQYKQKFIAAMDDDLNTADAIAALFDMVREVNANITATSNSSITIIEFASNLIKELGNVLGILQKSQQDALDEEIEELIAKRQQARKEKNWAVADSIRDQLKEMGIVLEDTPQGVKWRKI